MQSLCRCVSFVWEEEYLDRAVDNANFIVKHQVTPTYGLWHSHKDGKSSIEGFLDDYAFCIAAFIRLYEATFEDKWLTKASQLFDYTIRNFKDEEEKYWYVFLYLRKRSTINCA